MTSKDNLNYSKNDRKKCSIDPCNFNRTLFVDSKYGNDSTGEREDPNRPYRNLYFALSRAVEGDIIYVRPGDYDEDGLILKNKVNWYFESGAIVRNATSTSTFIISSSIKSYILGYGTFFSAKHIVHHINGIAKLVIRGEYFSNSECSMFDFSAFECRKSKVDIKGTKFEGPIIFRINSDIKIIFNFDQIETCDSIIDVSDDSCGKLIMNGNSIIRNTKDKHSNGFYFKSGEFNADITVQEYISRSCGCGYAIAIKINKLAKKSIKLNFNFQTFDCIGGAVSSFAKTLTFPPSQAEQLLVPEITFIINQLTVVYDESCEITTAPFLFFTSIQLFSFNVFTANIRKAYSVFDIGYSVGDIKGQVANITFSDCYKYCHYFVHSPFAAIINFYIDILNIIDGGLSSTIEGQITFEGVLLHNLQTKRPSTPIYSEKGLVRINILTISIEYPPKCSINTVEIKSGGEIYINFQVMNVSVENVTQNQGDIFHIDGSLYINGDNLNTTNARYAVFLCKGDLYVNLQCQRCIDCGGYSLNDKSVIDILELNLNTHKYNGNSAFFLNNYKSNVTITISEFNYNVPNIDAFVGCDGNLNVSIQQINVSGGGDGFFIGPSCDFIASILDFVISNTQNKNPTSAFYLENEAVINCKNLDCKDEVNGLTIKGTDGGFTGSIENFFVTKGSAVIYLAGKNVYLNFQQMTKKPSSLIGASNLFTINGSGSCLINGQQIVVNDTDTPFIIGDIISSGNGIALIKVEQVLLNNIKKISTINDYLGELNITELNVRNGTLINGIEIKNTNDFLIRGQIHIIEKSVSGNPIYIISSIGSTSPTNLNVEVDYISNIGRVIHFDSKGKLDVKVFKMFKVNPSMGGPNNVPVISLQNDCEVTLQGHTLISDSATVNAIEVKGNVELMSNWNYINVAGPSIFINSTSPVWHVCERAYSNAVGPVVLITCPGTTAAVPTIGGYMSTGDDPNSDIGYVNVVEVTNTTNQYPALRILGSMLVANKNSGFSIYNHPSNSQLSLSVQPSSSNKGANNCGGAVALITVNAAIS